MARRAHSSWTARAFVVWMGLFALFSLAPSHVCEATLNGLSLCVSGAPPLGMDFMPVRQSLEDKTFDAALQATEVLGVLLVIAGLIWMIRQMAAGEKKGRSDDRPF